MDVRETGWPQFATEKSKVVFQFLHRKDLLKNRPTQTEKGLHAEALVRKWINRFLPKKYGVTSGYIIHPQDAFTRRDHLRLLHYDFILYNKLESPNLWIEKNPDQSSRGARRAIPFEYVQAVFEVKSTFNKRNITNAFEKLAELTPWLENATHMQKMFFTGIIFFELPQKEQKNLNLLNELTKGIHYPHFIGGLVLTAEGLDPRLTARFNYQFTNDPPLQLNIFAGETLTREGGLWSDCQPIGKEERSEHGENIYKYACTQFNWSLSNMPLFLFELLERMNGIYEPGIQKTSYGLVSLKETQ